jgi:mannose-6-phosphate isomerase-like protein (cupin superfamily)
MAVRVASCEAIEPVKLPGRELRWLVTPETIGAEKIAVNIMLCPAGSIVRPMHSHKDIEEVLLILEGEGEVWIDGELGRFKQGDAVLLPANSKHQVRSLGPGPLRTACIFSAPTTPASFVSYDQDAFL